MSLTGVNSADVYASYASTTNKKTATDESKVKSTTSKEAASSTAKGDTTNVATDGVVYEKSDKNTSNKASYSINKMSAEERAALVKQLKDEQADRQRQLLDIVNQMITKQAGTSRLADLFSPENLKNVDPATIAQAKEDVSEDGYWGVKQTSQRLFDFASALAGDDPEKMKEMQKAMEKGFKQATKAWGDELPDICKQTMEAANKLFEDYYASK